jgi:hypothetical protein
MQPFSCQHREHHISKQDYEISVVQEIHIPDQNHKGGPLNMLCPCPFLTHILGFGIEVWLISFRVMESKSQLDKLIFSIYFSNYEKFKYFVETFTPYNQKLIFEEHLRMSNMDFYI